MMCMAIWEIIFLRSKQRIEIVRALYPSPEIVILDEATSSLDIENENMIIKKLSELKGDKTIIMRFKKIHLNIVIIFLK